MLGGGAAGDGKLTRRPARHDRRTCAPATAPPCAAPTSKALDASIDTLLAVRAPQRRADQPARRAPSPASSRSRGDDDKQLSDTEDADIAKTLIDLNSQSAAYQAALRAGANIVQTSLMDFLR